MDHAKNMEIISKTGTKTTLILRNRKRQFTFLGHIMRKDAVINVYGSTKE